MKQIPDNSIDLTVTSPPYDDLRDYEGYTFDFESIARELFRVTKEGGVVVWVVGDKTENGSESGTSFKQALYFKDIGFNLHDTMIYQKYNTTPLNHNRYEQSFEYMFILSKYKPKTFNPIKTRKLSKRNRTRASFLRESDGVRKFGFHSQNTTKIIGNVWLYEIGYSRVTKDKITRDHPAIFPEQLTKDHILSWSNEGDLILDPFAGSGTTLKMALLLNRNFIGIEISEKYCEIARKRIEKARQSKSYKLETFQ